jgi:hypothetical protein
VSPRKREDDVCTAVAERHGDSMRIIETLRSEYQVQQQDGCSSLKPYMAAQVKQEDGSPNLTPYSEPTFALNSPVSSELESEPFKAVMLVQRKVQLGVWKGKHVLVSTIDVQQGDQDSDDVRGMMADALQGQDIAHENVVRTYVHELKHEVENGALCIRLRLIQVLTPSEFIFDIVCYLPGAGVIGYESFRDCSVTPLFLTLREIFFARSKSDEHVGILCRRHALQSA